MHPAKPRATDEAVQLHSKPDAARQLGIGRSSLEKLVGAGAIKQVKIGGRALIPDSEIRRFVDDLVAKA